MASNQQQRWDRPTGGDELHDGPTPVTRGVETKTGPNRRIVTDDGFYRQETDRDAGLPPFTPHRFRNTVVQMCNRFVTTPEDLKAVSNNLGHRDVRMTVDGYGQISQERQGEVMKRMRDRMYGR